MVKSKDAVYMDGIDSYNLSFRKLSITCSDSKFGESYIATFYEGDKMLG
jgi:hypothetical protein